MTPLDFGYWLRGLMGAGVPVVDIGSYALKKAAEILELKPVRAEPPAMRALLVHSFCMHNVHLAELCAACARVSSTERLHVLALPIGAKQVYIPASPYQDKTDGTVRNPARGGGAGTDDAKAPEGQASLGLGNSSGPR